MMASKAPQRHSREGGNPAILVNRPFELVLAAQGNLLFNWIPAFAGMTVF
jgi:hypothetical protein